MYRELRQIVLEQITLPGTTVFNAQCTGDRVRHIAAPVRSCRALPVAKTHLAAAGDVPVLEVHVPVCQRMWQTIEIFNRRQGGGPDSVDSPVQARRNHAVCDQKTRRRPLLHAKPQRIGEELAKSRQLANAILELGVLEALPMEFRQLPQLALDALASHHGLVIAEGLHGVAKVAQDDDRIDGLGVKACEVTDRRLDIEPWADIGIK